MGVLLQYLTDIGTQAALLGWFTTFSRRDHASRPAKTVGWRRGSRASSSAAAFSFGMMMYTVLHLDPELVVSRERRPTTGSAASSATSRSAHATRQAQGVMRAFFASTFASSPSAVMQVWLIVHLCDLAQFIAELGAGWRACSVHGRGRSAKSSASTRSSSRRARPAKASSRVQRFLEQGGGPRRRPPRRASRRRRRDRTSTRVRRR